MTNPASAPVSAMLLPCPGWWQFQHMIGWTPWRKKHCNCCFLPAFRPLGFLSLQILVSSPPTKKPWNRWAYKWWKVGKEFAIREMPLWSTSSLETALSKWTMISHASWQLLGHWEVIEVLGRSPCQKKIWSLSSTTFGRLPTGKGASCGASTPRQTPTCCQGPTHWASPKARDKCRATIIQAGVCSGRHAPLPIALHHRHRVCHIRFDDLTATHSILGKGHGMHM